MYDALHFLTATALVSTSCTLHLGDERAQENRAVDGVAEDAFKDIALSVDLAGVDLVEELHVDEGVEDHGVVL